MPRKRLSLFVLPLIVLACSILGGVYGPSIPVASAAAAGPDVSVTEEFSLNKDVDRFARFYSLVEQNFAEPLSADTAIYKGAIPGMLRTLDPHSYFLDPKSFQSLREEQKGSYYGVGMHVTTRGGKTVVVSPFVGYPAYKAGLHAGDIIVSVNDKPTDGLNTSEVADLLKGPRNTQVKIVISREGAPDYLPFNVTRDEINRKSVPDGFIVKPGVAYVKILSFAEGTARELDDNLKRLGEGSLKGLVLDLRGNPGGLLNAGIAVSDHFLQKGQLIVSHHGRSAPERPYFARNGNHGLTYPIVVLVDRSSASAAEIVSGALQDHDRALILGETTFGKGLVQTVYPLAGNTAVAITIAHFYTPSGRLIQRDYTNKSFYSYYYNHNGSDRNPLDVKMTDSGSGTVYGGGGITPDEKSDLPPLDAFQADLLRDKLFSFTRIYFSKHSTSLPKGWLPNEEVVEQLHDFLLEKNVKFTEADFALHHDWIKRYLTREMYLYAFDEDASDRIFAEMDPEVARAVDALPRAQALAQTARRVIVQRMAPTEGRPAVAHR